MDGQPLLIDAGREICGDLDAAERREWLCTNGLGGFAAGTIAGTPTRRYHALLVAPLQPPVGRTVMAAQVHEDVAYAGGGWPLHAARWAGGVVNPQGFAQIERFRLEGTTPVWTFACADALVDKRVWMEPGANTTYVRYQVVRAQEPLTLTLRPLIGYRDYHATTRAGDWHMGVARVDGGVRVTAFPGARSLLVLAPGAVVEAAHEWYRDLEYAEEIARGLDAHDDVLHVATVTARLAPGQALTLVLSAEAAPDPDGAAAYRRRQAHEADLTTRWQRAQPAAASAPAWIRHLVLAADQFVVRRPLADDPAGATVIAGYPWFADWGRDTMIALPGLALTTGRSDVARRILTTFARFVDRGMLPNRFPDAGEAPEYNTVDATLWYVEAIRAYHEATGDDGLLRELFGVLESIVACHRAGTRYGIRQDGDGLLTAGEPGVQLTWMDARVGDWVVTPRAGKPVEINALWYNALCAMSGFARRLGAPAAEYETQAERVRSAFERFWSGAHGWCFDVIDGPDGDDASLRPNQILAVSLAASPLPVTRQRAVVDVCGRYLLTSYGLRSLAPGDHRYQGRYGGDAHARDGAYHQGTAWSWLLGPFALAYFRVHGDAGAARALLAPLAHHLADHGLGSIAEIFDGEAPFAPDGCPAQAWGVAETLRAWHVLAAAAPRGAGRVS